MFVLALAEAVAHAEDTAQPADPPPYVPTQPQSTSEPAPPPDQANGVVREEDGSATSGLIWIPRAVLFVPRATVWAAAQPIRGVTYVYERYDLGSRFLDATFTDDRRFGIYPVAGYDSSFGFSVGGRMLYKDIFGEGERIKLRADWGGEFRYGYGMSIRTGDRFGPISLGYEANYERRRGKFYGIGNNGPTVDTVPDMPVDPTLGDVGIKSRYAERVIRNTADLKIQYVEELRSRVSAALMLREFGPDEQYDITMNYDTSKLVGFDSGVKNVYVEHELAYDTRRPTSEFNTQTLDATGWLASVHTGAARGIEGDPTHYYRYGAELQRYLDLYEGSRVLAFRVLFDAVAGTDVYTDGKISFVDLPRLGGKEYLRGYPSDRFRDRAVALGTAEYSWLVGGNLAAYTFVDVGRPLDSPDDATTVDSLRVGFGGGLQVHTRNTFFTRIQLAASREGDFLFNVVFSPAFGRRERAGKY
jgi:outer membrane protein assembly factor BamA